MSIVHSAIIYIIYTKYKTYVKKFKKYEDKKRYTFVYRFGGVELNLHIYKGKNL